MKENYNNECKIIEEDCTYTAEAHYYIAGHNKRLSFWFQVIPAVIAALSGLLVAGEIIPICWIWLTVISAVVSAVGNVLNPMKEYHDHLNAAKNFTVLKHKARALYKTFGINIPDDQCQIAVKALHDEYGNLVRCVPPTDEKSFEKAKKRIKAGIHEQDSET